MKTERGDMGKKTRERGTEGRVDTWEIEPSSDFSLYMLLFLLQAAFLGSHHTQSKKYPSSSSAAPITFSLS